MKSAETAINLPAFIGAELTKEKDYWLQKLSGELSRAGLPPDFPRPRLFVDEKGMVGIKVEPGTADKLFKVSGRRPALAFAVLITVLKICLYKYTGTGDIIVGAAIHEDHRDVAPLNQVLAVRDLLDGSLTVRQLLLGVKNTLAEAYAHQKYPFDNLLELLHAAAPANRAPLFDVVVTLDDINNRERVGHLKADLSLAFSTVGDAFSGTVEYNASLFRRETIELFAEHYRLALCAVLDSPDAKISEVELLSAAERHKLLHEFNRTETASPRHQLVHQLFAEQVEKTPSNIAVTFEDDRLTYRELDGRANRLARFLLRRYGLGPDALVGLCVGRSVEAVVAILATLKAGAAYLPLDPGLPASRLRFMVEDAAPRLVLSESGAAGRLSETGAEVVCLEEVREEVGRESAAAVEVGDERWGGEQLAYCIYTSGSTGTPKGVMISHSALCNHMCWMQAAFPLDESDRVLQKTPFSFDAAVWEFYAPLLSGAQLVMARPGSHQNSAALVEQMIEQQVSVVQAVPTLLQMLVEEPGLERCTWLRRVFCGGEALRVELARRLHGRLKAELINLYGPTETTVECSSFRSDRELAGHRTVPIGRPIANTQMYVLDRQLRLVPTGVAGELYVSGAGLARGYLKQPGLTAEKFLPHPFLAGGARLYRTGDRARYLADGEIEFLGRMDEQVKVRGYRVELGEIEATLKQHPSVRECAVVVRDDEADKRRVVAYVVGRRRNPPTSGQLRDFLKEKLPEHMLPAMFVMLDTMPLSPNGKIARRMLPDPQSLRQSAAGNYVAPRNEVERIIADIWQEVLKVEKIGVDENFFDLGGHSLLMFHIQARLRAAFRQDLSAIDLFKYPSVSSLAERLSREAVEQPSFQAERERARKQRETINRGRRILS